MPSKEQIAEFIRIREKRQRIKAYREETSKKYDERFQEHAAESVLIEGSVSRSSRWIRKHGR